MPVTMTPEIAWRALSPVLALAGGAIISLLAGSIIRQVNRMFLAVVTGVSLIVALGLSLWSASVLIDGMDGMIVVDGVTVFITAVIIGAAALTTVISFPYMRARRIHRFEFYPLLLVATAGMVLLAQAGDLLMVFIAIEVLSLALYVMVGIARNDPGSREASMKYFLLGAFSSAVLLYGVALIYGATGSTNIADIADAVAAGTPDARVMLAAAGLLAVGFAFKVGAVPFHMWTPDVYEGAPTNVTGFMAVGTKAAAFAALARVFIVSFGTLQWDWRPVLWGVALVTMVVGSLVAVVQTDVKRLLAYSSIAHAGFILIGVVAASRQGVAGMLFYLAVYGVMTIGAFAAIAASAPGGAERLDLASWAGMGQRNPLFAAAMTLFLLSLAGIPPTAGFMGKFYVFASAVDAGETGLVIAGLLASVVAAFFYLRLIVLMWLQPADEFAPDLGLSAPSKVVLGLTAAATVGLGVYPQVLIDVARAAAVFTG